MELRNSFGERGTSVPRVFVTKRQSSGDLHPLRNAVKNFQTTEPAKTPSYGLSATFSPCNQGEKGLRETLRERDDKILNGIALRAVTQRHWSLRRRDCLHFRTTTAHPNPRSHGIIDGWVLTAWWRVSLSLVPLPRVSPTSLQYLVHAMPFPLPVPQSLRRLLQVVAPARPDAHSYACHPS